MTPSPTAPERCVLCDGASLGVEYAGPRLRVFCCAACGHRTALHLEPPAATDYYEQTPQSDRFVATLEATRRRQARRLIEKLAELGGTAANWFDFGFGRGWFLDEARPDIRGGVGGFESSPLAVRWAESRGLSVAKPLPTAADWPDFATLDYEPEVVSLLDVVEHLDGSGAERALQRLRAELPALGWLIVKVPSSDGVLYRTSRALAGLAPGPYEQLYQVGTLPPHYHYFNPRSLARLLERSGYDVRALLFDRDVDNLFHRIGSLRRLPGGGLAARAVGMFPNDSVIAFATVSA